MVASFLTNPLVLTLAVGAAIGLAIYEFFEQEKRRRAPLRHDSRPQNFSNSRRDSGNLNPSSKPVRSTTPKTVNSISRDGNAPIKRGNSQRIQSFHPDKERGSSSTSEKRQSIKQKILNSKTVNSDTIRNSIYDEKNYEKDVCDKIRNDVNQNVDDENKTFPEKVDDGTVLENNIDTKELNIDFADYSSSTFVQKNQMADPESNSKHVLYNLCEKKQNTEFADCSSSGSIKKNQMVDSKSNSNHLLYNICEKEQNPVIDMSDDNDQNESEKEAAKVFAYKKQVLDKIMDDVKSSTEGHSIKKVDNNADCATISEVQESEIKVLKCGTCTEKEQNSKSSSKNGLMDTNYNPSQTLCSGCMENPVNAVNDPCQHICFCMECAAKVFKIYEYCTECRSEIVSFHNA